MKMAQISTFALIGALALAGPALAQQETERVNKTASIRAGGTLRVKNFSGTVTITGMRRGDVSIQAIRRATRERLDNIKLEITETGSGLTINANSKSNDWRDRDNNVVDTQLDIQVPDDVTLDVHAHRSALEHRWQQLFGVATASKDRPDAGDQLSRREGLGDVVVGAEL